MGQVYEDLYQHLISEGIDDSVATSVVNNMYDKKQYHDVEQLDEAAFRAASMIGRIAAKVFRAGKITPRVARGIGASTLRTLNRRGSEAFQRGVRRRNWTPDKALPSGTSGAPFRSRMDTGLEKARLAAAGGTSSGPATPVRGSSTPSALPAAGQTASRRNVAAATAATAAAGTRSTGVRTGTTSAIVKRKPSLSDKVKGALVGAGAALTSPTAKKVAKVAGATALGAGALGLGSALMGGDKKASTPKKDTAPATPKGGVVADKAPAKPAVSIKKRMTKIDRDMKELMGMRAASMDRQGRSKDAAKLRSEIEKKFAGYED